MEIKPETITDLFEEQQKMMDTLYELQDLYASVKHKIYVKECDLILNTDFKGHGLTNKDQRDAYVKSKLLDDLADKESLEKDIHYTKSMINYIENKILFFKEFCEWLRIGKKMLMIL